MASKRCLHRFMAQNGSMNIIRVLLFNQCNGLKSVFLFYAVQAEEIVGYDTAVCDAMYEEGKSEISRVSSL